MPLVLYLDGGARRELCLSDGGTINVRPPKVAKEETEMSKKTTTGAVRRKKLNWGQRRMKKKTRTMGKH
jgi:hypothetical protein